MGGVLINDDEAVAICGEQVGGLEGREVVERGEEAAGVVGRFCRARRRGRAFDRWREGEAALAAAVEAVGARWLVG